MNIDQLKNLFQHYRLKPNFTYGQNFLVDDAVLQDIVDAAGLTSADNVLEIGPGIGNLTRLLCQRAGFVLSIEKDPKFLPILKSIKKDFRDNFRFEIADALEHDFQEFFENLEINNGVILRSASDEGSGKSLLRNSSASDALSLRMTPKYKVVANIPYYITGKLLQMLLGSKFKPASIVVLTQKEVAQSIVAQPGSLSLLAISVQLFGRPEIVKIVPAKSFYPAPKVDSAIVKIVVFDKPRYEVGDEKKLFSVLKSCFAGKRKQIHNTLTHNLKLDKETARRILTENKINPAARPQELSIEQWIRLADSIVASS